METIIEKERRLLAFLSQALTLAETGLMPMREVESRRRDLREFYAEVFGSSMLPTRQAIDHQIGPMEAELRRLRFEVEQLQEKIRKERRRATLLEEELAFTRQQQVHMARQRLNGVTA